MKDAPRLRGGLPVRLVALFGGLVLFGFAIVFMLESRLGLPPWDVLHFGIAAHTPLSLGVSGIVVGLIIVAVTWLEGTQPGFGTIANVIVIGVTIDVLRSIDAIDAPFGIRPAGPDRAPRRGGVAVRRRLRLLHRSGDGRRSPRLTDDGVVSQDREADRARPGRDGDHRLLCGLALGGIAGIGTLTLALLVGPVVELAFWLLVKLGLATPGRRDALEFGPLDAA